MVIQMDDAKDQEYFDRLLRANHAAFEQHLACITGLRSALENEEAKLAFCLYEERRILDEMRAMHEKQAAKRKAV